MEGLEDVEHVLDEASKACLPLGVDYHMYQCVGAHRDRADRVRAKIEEAFCTLTGSVKEAKTKGKVFADAFKSSGREVDFIIADALEDVTDDLLDAADDLLDKHKRDRSAGSTEKSPKFGVSREQSHRRGGSMSRPQDSWVEKPENSQAPFVHRPFVSDCQQEDAAQNKRETLLLQRAQKLGFSKPTSMGHPLGKRNMEMKYESWMLECEQAQAFRTFDETPFTYIDTLPELNRFAKKIQNDRVIAVDLENHSRYSYQGFLCLMQVSTRTEDYIIDVIALREHVGPALAHIFADPEVVKVMHGATSDILWLQRCHNTYVCNLFDTGQAARVLNYPYFGLAYLLQRFCNYTTDKKYQLADWRIRPLPDHLVTYARADTHFLLYIYDRMLMELNNTKYVPKQLAVDIPAGKPKGPLGTVLQLSTNVVLQLYEKPSFSETSYLDYYGKQRNVKLDPKQLAVFAGLYAWRDAKARELDESPDAVLVRNQLFELAQRMPQSVSLVSSICNKRQGRKNSGCAEFASDIHQVIQSSSEQELSFGRGSLSRAKDSTNGNNLDSSDGMTKQSEKQRSHIRFDEKAVEETAPVDGSVDDVIETASAAKAACTLLESIQALSTNDSSAVWSTLNSACTDGGDEVSRIMGSIRLPFLRLEQIEPQKVTNASQSTSQVADGDHQPASTSADALKREINEWAKSQSSVSEPAPQAQQQAELDCGEAEKNKAALPQSLSKQYQIGKSRNQRTRALDKSQPQSQPSVFDYSKAKADMEAALRGNKRGGKSADAPDFFVIPDRHLVPSAKRRKQPHTGNKSMTFR